MKKNNKIEKATIVLKKTKYIMLCIGFLRIVDRNTSIAR